MTFTYRTISNPAEKWVHDVISVVQVSAHTYEFTQHGRQGKLRVTEVTDLRCDNRCLCHASGR